jgi:hypothetical protein
LYGARRGPKRRILELARSQGIVDECEDCSSESFGEKG